MAREYRWDIIALCPWPFDWVLQICPDIFQKGSRYIIQFLAPGNICWKVSDIKDHSKRRKDPRFLSVLHVCLSTDFPHSAIFMETSSKDGRNILDSLVMLAREMCASEDVEVTNNFEIWPGCNFQEMPTMLNSFRCKPLPWRSGMIRQRRTAALPHRGVQVFADKLLKSLTAKKIIWFVSTKKLQFCEWNHLFQDDNRHKIWQLTKSTRKYEVKGKIGG